jgi:hypothetical protein
MDMEKKQALKRTSIVLSSVKPFVPTKVANPINTVINTVSLGQHLVCAYSEYKQNKRVEKETLTNLAVDSLSVASALVKLHPALKTVFTVSSVGITLYETYKFIKK